MQLDPSKPNPVVAFLESKAKDLKAAIIDAADSDAGKTVIDGVETLGINAVARGLLGAGLISGTVAEKMAKWATDATNNALDRLAADKLATTPEQAAAADLGDVNAPLLKLSGSAAADAVAAAMTAPPAPAPVVPAPVASGPDLASVIAQAVKAALDAQKSKEGW